MRESLRAARGSNAVPCASRHDYRRSRADPRDRRRRRGRGGRAPARAGTRQHEARLVEQRAGRYRYLVAWDDVPIGHVGLALPSDRHPADLCEWGELGIVEDLWVQPPARRRGAGRQLMLVLEAEARAAGIAEVGLDTGLDDGYAAARALYRGLGYVRRTGPYVVSARMPPDHPTLRYWMDIVTAWSKRLAPTP
jgi:GNAT superfamily N-acetyltransferase